MVWQSIHFNSPRTLLWEILIYTNSLVIVLLPSELNTSYLILISSIKSPEILLKRASNIEYVISECWGDSVSSVKTLKKWRCWVSDFETGLIFANRMNFKEMKDEWKHNKRTGEFWRGGRPHSLRVYTLSRCSNNRLLRVRTVVGRNNEAN